MGMRLSASEARRLGLVAPAVVSRDLLPDRSLPIDPAAQLASIPDEFVVVRGLHLGEPLAKKRPRFSRRSGSVYTPSISKAHELALAAVVADQILGVQPDSEWAFGIRAVFYVQSHQRKDVDNMMKSVLDAMNRRVFKDDSQVKEIMGWSVLDTANPRTEFVVYRIYRIVRAMGACVRCGTMFRKYNSWRNKPYCSRNCSSAAQQKRVETTCSGCGKLFETIPCHVENAKQNYCSRRCRSVRYTVECTVCKSPISRPRSWQKPGQTNFYCGTKCRAKGQTGRKRTESKEELSAIAKRAWETRRRTQAA